jgi:DNA-binding transcriptional ArsR family regulator
VKPQPKKRLPVEKQIDLILRRLAKLEAKRAQSPLPLPQIASHDLILADLLATRKGSPYEKNGKGGAIAYGGAIDLGKNRKLMWQAEKPFPALHDLDAANLIRIFSALASEARLTLIRALVHGPKTSTQLQITLGVDSPGQLYHHLKELLAVGIVEQHERSEYSLSPRKVIPFFVILGAVYELSNSSNLPLKQASSATKTKK